MWAWPVGLGLTFASGGRPYYTFPLTVAVALAGVVAHDHHRDRPRLLPWLIAVNAAFVIPLALPVLPVSKATSAIAVNEPLAETIGWPELVAQVADVVSGLPASERGDVVLLAASYGEAGALDRYRADHDLPPAYSAHNHYAEFRQPTNDHATVVAIRYRPGDLATYFDRCQRVAIVEIPHDVPNEVNGAAIIICRGLKGTWQDIWPQLRHLS